MVTALEFNQRRGFYIASRVRPPERPAEWRRLRDECGYPITCSWIDEAGDGDTADFTELWDRILREIKSSEGLILYAEPEDFPLKGAIFEAGAAVMAGVPTYVCLPGVKLEGRTCRPIGSWIHQRLVTRVDSVKDVLDGTF